ncbi:7808_t:CDS:1, partial [Gigaspora margarita]
QRMYKKLNDYWAILQNCCNVSVVMDPSIKLSAFNDKTAPIIREILYSVYAQYSNEEICSANTDDSSRNYFRKHRNEKSKNNT